MGFLEAIRWLMIVVRLFGAADTQTLKSHEPLPESTAADVFDSLELNQAFIEARRPELRDATDRNTKPGALRLREPAPDTPGPDFDDPRSVVRFLLGVIESGTVYPTEGYFYFRFHLNGRRISGNLRFTSIADGVLHTGYFETGVGASRKPGGPPGIGAVRTGSFRIEQGLTVVSEPGTGGETLHRISLDGESAAFVIPTIYRARPASLQLRESERFVSGVLDESGYALALIFIEDDPAFRFLLHPEFEPLEKLVPIHHAHHARAPLLAGTESEFIFMSDEARKSRESDREIGPEFGPEIGRLTLVGVSAERIMANDYFDGPFDQVPPDLALRPMLHAAYPYTRTASPIDEHGNFLGRDASRVAIAPYTAFASRDALTEAIGNASIDSAAGQVGTGPGFDTGQLIRTLTREYQQDFAPPLRVSPIPDALPVGPEPMTLQDILERRKP